MVFSTGFGSGTRTQRIYEVEGPQILALYVGAYGIFWKFDNEKSYSSIWSSYDLPIVNFVFFP